MERYRNLYAKHGEDLMKVKLRAGPCAAKGLSSDMELELAYLRIRDTRPNMVSHPSCTVCASTISKHAYLQMQDMRPDMVSSPSLRWPPA